MADFPGIGASMRTRGAANARAMSSERVVIRFTRTPWAGCNSYRVITGPTVMLMILAEMWKLCRVSISSLAFSAGFSCPLNCSLGRFNKV